MKWFMFFVFLKVNTKPVRMWKEEFPPRRRDPNHKS